MLEDLLALIAPPACAMCGDGCEVRCRLCERCERALRGQAPVWSAVPGIGETWSAAPYDGAARELVGPIVAMTITLGPLVSLIAGILILIMPRLLNYIVAVYLIAIGIIGLFGPIHIARW